MRKWLRWRRLRLPVKLLLVYTPLIVLPTITGLLIVTDSFGSSSRDTVSRYSRELLALMTEKIDAQVARGEKLSLQLFADAELRRLIATEPRTRLEDYELTNQIAGRVKLLALGTESRFVRTMLVSSGNRTYVIGDDDIRGYGFADPELADAIGQAAGANVWFLPETFQSGSSSFRALRLGRMIRDERFQEIGRLLLVLDVQGLKDIFGQTNLGDGVAVRLQSAKGEPIADNGVRADENNPLVITVDSAYNGWRLSAIIPHGQLDKPIAKAARLSLLIMAGGVILGLLVTQIIAVDVIFPIRRLMLNMKRGIKGIKPAQLERVRGAREIAEMNDTFISVMYEIHHLIDESVVNQKKKQAAEIRALQHQLSPHFLVNTLNTIRWMAMLQQQSNIKEMVDSLTRLLSYSLRDPDAVVRLSDEIAILRDYAKIQMVRYHNFQLELAVDTNTFDPPILKFLLQPLIENALLHGLAQTDRNGIIKVWTKRHARTWSIVVADNGAGMSEEKRLELLRRIGEHAEGGRVGLRSVQERIQLHYGLAYGLSVESKSGEGTTVTLSMPAPEGDFCAAGGTGDKESAEGGTVS